ncbi:hypothetical protein AB1Y20_023609 [Prymnesium parvum]|uniref:C2H2-type domain-containing protein n=1 Tax=Prymnesium parvum TaxID=97485 RepID=A0AB34JFX2_PRYPA
MLAAEETEALVELEMIRLLHAALLSASASLVGASHAHVWRLPKESLRRTRQPDVGADLSCHAPATVWKRLPRQPDGTARVRTLSEFGVAREAEFADARALGLAIGEGMGARAAACVADVRVKEDGTLLLTTQLHMRRQRMLGRLHCAACGQFFSGERGLRDHQQVKHGRSYGGAKAAVASARRALVAYAPPGGAAAELAALWLRRAAAKEEQRRALPEGLAAARDGQLRALRRLVGEGRFDAHATVDRHGSSALHFAAGGGHVEVCAYLVDELGVSLTQAPLRNLSSSRFPPSTAVSQLTPYLW